MSKPSDELVALKSMLQDKIGAEVYHVAADQADLLVVLCRLKPMVASDRDLKMAETRALKFIEDSLKVESTDNQFNFRFSRPWVLKKGKLAFTWDFTLKGDLSSAISALSKVDVLRAPASREEEVHVQTLKPRRGSVRQVSVGAIR